MIYNYVSAPGLSVNVRHEEALYHLHDGKLLVNGTFMTEVHISALVAGVSMCKWAHVSYFASDLNDQNWGWRAVKGSCGGHAFTLGPNANKSCSGMHTSLKMSTATVSVNPFTTDTAGAPFRIVAHGDLVHNRVAGPRHRLDIELSYSPQKTPVVAHGLVGQSFADSQPRFGNVDVYPDEGAFTTSAQAEGAIEGTGEMYEVREPFGTDFAFSKFASDGYLSAFTAMWGSRNMAEAGMAMCDTVLAEEIAYYERKLKQMALHAIQEGYNGWKRFIRLEEAEAATRVARATSLEVLPGEGIVDAHRRLAECSP